MVDMKQKTEPTYKAQDSRLYTASDVLDAYNSRGNDGNYAAKESHIASYFGISTKSLHDLVSQNKGTAGYAGRYDGGREFNPAELENVVILSEERARRARDQPDSYQQRQRMVANGGIIYMQDGTGDGGPTDDGQGLPPITAPSTPPTAPLRVYSGPSQTGGGSKGNGALAVIPGNGVEDVSRGQDSAPKPADPAAATSAQDAGAKYEGKPAADATNGATETPPQNTAEAGAAEPAVDSTVAQPGDLEQALNSDSSSAVSRHLEERKGVFRRAYEWGRGAYNAFFAEVEKARGLGENDVSANLGYTKPQEGTKGIDDAIDDAAPVQDLGNDGVQLPQLLKKEDSGSMPPTPPHKGRLDKGEKAVAYFTAAAIALAGSFGGGYATGRYSKQAAVDAALNSMNSAHAQYADLEGKYQKEHSSLTDALGQVDTANQNYQKAAAGLNEVSQLFSQLKQDIDSKLAQQGHEKPAQGGKSTKASKGGPKAKLPPNYKTAQYDEGSVVDHLREMGYEGKGNLLDVRTALYAAMTNGGKFSGTAEHGKQNISIDNYVEGKTKKELDTILTDYISRQVVPIGAEAPQNNYDGGAKKAQKDSAPAPLKVAEAQDIQEDANLLEPVIVPGKEGTRPGTQAAQAGAQPAYQSQASDKAPAQAAQNVQAGQFSADESSKLVRSVGDLFEIYTKQLRQWDVAQKDAKKSTIRLNDSHPLGNFPYDCDILTTKDLASMIRDLAARANGMQGIEGAFDGIVRYSSYDSMNQTNGTAAQNLRALLNGEGLTESELNSASQMIAQLRDNGYVDLGERIFGYQDTVTTYVEDIAHKHQGTHMHKKPKITDVEKDHRSHDKVMQERLQRSAPDRAKLWHWAN